ncbi:MAG: hypothetical protein D6679_07370 [Candidatus Hydrogenedentota bacterium]|nr:MAG: hypothetical protein D6679_07370 [Candidatus Hydrogenedentota bacterium]
MSTHSPSILTKNPLRANIPFPPPLCSLFIGTFPKFRYPPLTLKDFCQSVIPHIRQVVPIGSEDTMGEKILFRRRRG